MSRSFRIVRTPNAPTPSGHKENAMPASTVVVQIVGLVLMSFQIEPGRLIGVAPRIPCPSRGPIVQTADARLMSNVTTGIAATASVTAEEVMNSAQVEGHRVFLRIPRGGLKSASGWNPIKTTAKEYIYRIDE